MDTAAAADPIGVDVAAAAAAAAAWIETKTTGAAATWSSAHGRMKLVAIPPIRNSTQSTYLYSYSY